ncbi:hypothetical protein GGS24DRAFT_18775 [Hypoxylon argillaceum]|nr:hypothetical protein GGS24DRAFT_18775 [Hypoxylon argillaceum]
MPVLKSLPQWPDPQESIGRQIPSSRVGKRTVWWPRGSALDAFEKLIQPEIEKNLERIDLGHADLFIRLYMIGRKPESANPIVMVCCTDSKARDAAEAAIRESGLLNSHEGFGLGAAALPLEHPAPVRRLSPKNEDCDLSTGNSKSDTATPPSGLLSSVWATWLFRLLFENTLYSPPSSSTPDEALPLIVRTLPSLNDPDVDDARMFVFSHVNQPILGRRIVTRTESSKVSGHHGHATAGVVITVGENYYQMTVGHLFQVESERPHAERSPTPLDECHFDGQSDDDEYDSDHGSGIARRGSLTSEEALSRDGSASDSASEETTEDSQDVLPSQEIQTSVVQGCKIPKKPSTNQFSIPIAYLPQRRSSRCSIDYAIIALPNNLVEEMGRQINTPRTYPTVTDVAKIGHEERLIIVVKYSAIIRGFLIPGQVAYRNHQTHQFESLIQIELERGVFEGDCGSPVLDASTGSFYGHIIMGVPGTKLAYIVQALAIFRDTEAKIGKSARIAVSTLPTSGLHCEFIWYGICDKVFALDDVDNWIDHIVIYHLQGALPKKAACWFCDDLVFDSKYAAGCRQNFNNRMYHIREHFLTEGLSAKDMRPDHYMNTYLRKATLISESMYRTVRRYTQVSQRSYILPQDSALPEKQLRDQPQEHAYTNPLDEERSYGRNRHRSGGSRK